MNKQSSLFALILIIPAQSLGIIFGVLVLANTLAGKIIFTFSKFWLFLLPLFWLVFIDKQKLSWSLPKKGGFITGALFGIIVSLLIISVYLFIARKFIDPPALRQMVQGMGLTSIKKYLLIVVYWVMVNSLLEEYAWRWFVVEKSEVLMPSSLAIVVSALGFSLHHIIAMQVYFNWLLVLIASTGIFIGALFWSWCYVKFRSIWPGYLSHAIIDIAVFGIGYVILFK